MPASPDRSDHYADTYAGFRWVIPERFNIGVAVCDRHAADPARADRPAIIEESADGRTTVTTFRTLKALTDRLAGGLADLGVGRGDRVAILLPQRLETAVAHIAAYKLGAIAVPLFTLFGEDALAFRLQDSGAKVVITDGANVDRAMALRDRRPDGLPDAPMVICADDDRAPAGLHTLSTLMTGTSRAVPLADTGPDDPALIIYTSGTTGKPKGALHAHRVLLGHLPGVSLPHELFPQPGDRFWTPADWAWIGGLLDVLLPALYHGVPVVAHRAAKFDPEAALALMARQGIRNVFFPPTALRMVRQVPNANADGAISLRSIGSGGETLGESLLDWGQETFGVTINEFYGQTECNLVVGNCSTLFPVRPGAMGRPIPGHRVAVVDESGTPLSAGALGSIAVHRPDPVMFLGYWNNPQATEAKFAGDWLLTGDTGYSDEDGYLWFKGRDDDVITSAGYRIGPGEVEDVLSRHPAVAMVAVVGVPDPQRTEAVKAFIVPRDPAVLDDPGAQAALAADIQAFAKAKHAAHAYPRQVAFLDSLPTTATGKIRRKDLRELEG